MFSKSRIHDKGPKAGPSGQAEPAPSTASQRTRPEFGSGADFASASGKGASKPAASVLASDLTITGNLRSTGDIVIEGNIDGDINAHLLTVGETATIRGEVVADDIVVNGRVVGRVRGLKVRLTATARVEGDIIHKTIAIESGAHFEGSVQRQEDPLAGAQQPAAHAPGLASAAASPAPAHAHPASAAASSSTATARAAAPTSAARSATDTRSSTTAPKAPAPAAKQGD